MLLDWGSKIEKIPMKICCLRKSISINRNYNKTSFTFRIFKLRTIYGESNKRRKKISCFIFHWNFLAPFKPTKVNRKKFILFNFLLRKNLNFAFPLYFNLIFFLCFLDLQCILINISFAHIFLYLVIFIIFEIFST